MLNPRIKDRPLYVDRIRTARDVGLLFLAVLTIAPETLPAIGRIFDKVDGYVAAEMTKLVWPVKVDASAPTYVSTDPTQEAPIQLIMSEEYGWDRQEIAIFQEQFHKTAKILNKYFGPPQGTKTATLWMEEKGSPKAPLYGEWYGENDTNYRLAKGNKVSKEWIAAELLSNAWGYQDIEIEEMPSSLAGPKAEPKVSFPEGQYLSLSGLGKYSGIMAKTVEYVLKHGDISPDYNGDELVIKILSVQPDFFIKLSDYYKWNNRPQKITYQQWLDWLIEISPEVYNLWTENVSLKN